MSLDASLNMQRALRGIVAAEVGKFLDPDLAEAKQRISRVCISREAGEGSRITLKSTGCC